MSWCWRYVSGYVWALLQYICMYVSSSRNMDNVIVRDIYRHVHDLLSSVLLLLSFFVIISIIADFLQHRVMCFFSFLVLIFFFHFHVPPPPTRNKTTGHPVGQG